MSLTFLEFSAGKGFGVTILSAILFPINSPIALAGLSTAFLEAGIRESSSALVAVSNNCFPQIYLSGMIKIHIL